MRIVLLKIVASLIAAGLVWRLFRIRDRTLTVAANRLRGFDVGLLWIATRLVPILVIYVLAHVAPQSDVATCFWPQAIGAAGGKVPYRDFESFFSPAFPYLLALPTFLWRDPRALIVWLSLLEASTIYLTAKHGGFAERDARRLRFLLCAFLAPGPVLLSVIGGQEDFLLWTSGLLTWIALTRHSDLMGSVVATACALLTKATIVVPLALFAGMARSKLRFLSILVIVGSISCFILWRFTGTAFLAVLGQSGNISPPQVWLFLHLLTAGLIPAGASVVSFAVVLITVAAAFTMGIARHETLIRSHRSFAALWTFLFATMIVLSPKSQGAYLGYILLPLLTITIDDFGALIVWLVAGAIAVIEPSLFYRLGEPHPATFSEITSLPGWLDLALQLMLVGCLAWLARYGWKILRDGNKTAALPAQA